MKKHYFLLGVFLFLGIITGVSKNSLTKIIDFSFLNEIEGSISSVNSGEKICGTNFSNNYLTCTLTVRATISANETCNGGSTGSISSTASGGTSPYTYSWSPTGGTKSTASALTAGTYTINVTDVNGCTATARATITQPAVTITVRTSITANETCFGGITGRATATVSGGTSPYTYSWAPTGGTKSTASALSAGTYTIHATGHNGCSATATAIITQPAGMTITASVTANETCSGGITGKTSVTVSGGTSPYTYSWSPSGGTKSTASALSAGTYTIHVTGHTGCTGTATAIVTQPAAMTVTAAISANESCRGGSTGSISATPSGGTSPYTYSWSLSGGTNSGASALSAGTYTVHVTDHNGCSATARATLTQPTANLTVSATVTANGSCSVANAGSISSLVSGGTSPYTYSWTPTGGSLSTASGLSAGTYTITVMDNRGCTGTASATVTQSSSLSVSANTTANVSCSGGNIGSASSSVNGGTSPYTYSWSNTQLTYTASGLSAGTYTVTVMDNSGCIGSATATITQSSSLSVSANTTANVNCGGNNGSSSSTVNGGIAPYTYSWSNSQLTANASGLSAGTYTLTVTDNAGCISSATATVTQSSSLSVSANTTANVSCSGGNIGSASSIVSGGTSPYTYSWSNSQTTANASGLSAGMYTVTVFDNGGCIGSATATITQSSSLNVSAGTTNNVSCNGGNNGNASVNVSGGTSPYTYSWSNTQTTSNASGLSAGTYTLTITDNSGCISSDLATITQPAAINVSAGATNNVSCNGASTGSASVSVSGGASPYTYSWSNTQTTSNASGLSAGTYTLTITDNSGCISSDLATITQPAAINVSAGATNNVSCNGASTGSASVSVSGGASPYTYSWSNTQTTSNASGLSAGTYTLTITDNSGCISSDLATITQSAAINVSANTTANVSCGGGNTGSASSTVGGGTQPYTYSWSNSQTSANASGLSAGIYTLTVTDNAGCNSLATTTITQSSSLNVSAGAANNVNCNGANTGSASVIVSGGTSPYTYSWSNTQTASNASGLSAGTYTLTITDHSGCISSDLATITQPTAINVNAGATNNVSCNGGSTGSASVSVSGGTSPYTYSWSNTQTTSNASGLSAGTYTLTITDHNGCISSDLATITQPTAINVNAGATNNVSCNGGSTGSASVSVSGGTSPYTYSWSNTQTTSNASGLSAGTYTLTITDHNGCISSDLATITQPTAINVNAGATNNVSCNGGSTGSASVSVSGGTSPYTYSWSNTQTTSNASGLSAGTYTLTITDHNGCTSSDLATITQPAAMLISASVTANEGCNGGITGSVSSTISGGNSPYTYSWSPSGGSNFTASGLTAGIYIIHITSNTGCTATAAATITQPAAMGVSASVVAHEICNGGSTGSVSSTVSGGTSPYTYSWLPSGGSSSTASGLSAGTYTVRISSITGCTASVTVAVTQPAAATVTFSVTSETCNGGITGKITATPAGGTSPYTYSWSPSGGSTATATGLTAGIYTIRVTGHTGCSVTASATVNQPAAIGISTTINANVSCSSGNNGSVSAIPSGGTSPYTYSWSGGGTTSTKSGLIAGTYTVKVTDRTLCTATVSVVITQPTAVNISIASRSFPACNGSKGTVTANPASGGTSPYTYSWSAGGGINLSVSLGVGIYTITATDNHGCTGTASVTITQPIALRDSVINYFWCGTGADSATLGVKGGSAPYSFSWSTGGTRATQTGLAAGTYTVTVMDNNGCASSASTIITALTPPPTPILAVLTSDSIGFRVTNASTSASYVWTLTDYTGSYAGIGDTAYLPVWPRRATLTFYADSGTSCQAVASIHITHGAALLSPRPYPRWSNRGMYLEWGAYYLDSTYKVHNNAVTPVVNYCRNNHITYILIDGLQANGQSGGIFGVDTAGVNATNAANLISFIDSLKTRGGVKEVGIVCYHSQPFTDLDSNANSVLNFNLNNYLENVNATNNGLPWNEKIDVLSMDQEFWLNIKNTTNSSKDYMYSVEDFHKVHMPMLKSMYKAAHECSANNLRVEDYIETPLDPWGLVSDTALYQLKAGAMELDSIGIYTDRLLLSSYTGYHTVLWNEGDFIQIDSEMGLDRYHAYYKKEIWPVFSAENSDSGTCTKSYYYRGDDFSGSNLCTEKRIDTAEWIEKQYFDSLSHSENHLPTKVFTNNLNGRFYQAPMGADTNFQILGDMWFDYKTMINEGIAFDTNTKGKNRGYLRFYVTLGHDTQWVPPNTPPITVTAGVHGGKGPYSYMWYDLNNGKVLLYSTSSNSYTMGYNALLGNYPVSKLGVVVKDAGDSTATDYIFVYKVCKNGNGVRRPVVIQQGGETPVDEEIARVENSVKVYPNPNTGQFTVAISGNDGSAKYIEIYTMLGQQVLAEPLLNSRGNNTIFMATQPNGIYFYRVLSESGILVGQGKVMVERR